MPRPGLPAAEVGGLGSDWTALLPSGAVVLSQKRYQELLHELERLRQHVRQPEALAGVCQISGYVGRDTAYVRLDIRFRTQVADSLVQLGLEEARLVHAELDGELPSWGSGRQGLQVRVEQPGVHRLILELQARVFSEGPNRRLVVPLPRAAVTTLQLTLKEAVSWATIRGVGTVPAQSVHGTSVVQALLGTQEQLDLTWQTIEAAAEVLPRYRIQAEQRFSIQERSLEAEAWVQFVPVPRDSSQWHLHLTSAVAGGARQVTILGVDAEALGTSPVPGRSDTSSSAPRKTLSSEWSYDPQESLLTVRLREELPAGMALRLRVRWVQPHGGQAGTHLFLSGVRLAGVPGSIETGQVGIWATADLPFALGFSHREDVRRTDPQAVLWEREAGRPATAAFRYSRQPMTLQVHFHPARSWLEVRPVYDLQLGEVVVNARCEWDIGQIVRGQVREVVFRWPGAWQIDRILPAQVVADWAVVQDLPDRPTATGPHRGPTDRPAHDVRWLVVRLVQAQRTPLKLTIDASLVTPADNKLDTWLPTLVFGRRDFEGGSLLEARLTGQSELRVTVPADWEGHWLPQTRGLEMSLAEARDRPIRGQTTFTLNSARPESWRVHLGWQPRRYPVWSVLDAAVTRDQAWVQQILECRDSAPWPERLRIRYFGPQHLPGAIVLQRLDAGGRIRDTVPVYPGVRLTPRDAWTELEVDFPRDWKEGWRLHGTWLVSAPGQLPHVVTLPVVALESQAEAVCHARLWLAQDLELRRIGPGWQSSEHDGSQAAWPQDITVWPSHYLRSTTNWSAIELSVEGARAGALPTADVQRGAVLMRLAPDGRWHTQVLLSLHGVRTSELSFALPASGRWSVRWDGKELAADNNTSGVTRIAVPAARLGKAARLEFVGQGIIAGAWPRWTRFWPVHMRIPRPMSPLFVGEMRWVLVAPPGWIALCTDEGFTLVSRGQWPADLGLPQAGTRTRQIQEWVLGTATSDETDDAGYSWSRGSFEPDWSGLVVPLLGWALLCSVLAFVLGIAVLLVPRRHAYLWAVPALVVVLWLAVNYPGAVSYVLLGMQPGLVAWVVTASMVWLSRQRWQRKVLLLPGFSRTKSGSSVARAARIGADSSTLHVAPGKAQAP